MFPGSLIASMCNLEEAEYFEASEEAKDAPVVNFE